MGSAPLKLAVCALFCLSAAVMMADAEVYFEEDFEDETWEHRWTYSGYAGTEFGKFMRSSGYFYDDYEVDKGIQTMDDARFYALSRKFAPFSNQGRNLVVQYTVKHEQDIDCGGGYIKLFNCDMEPEQMNGNTPYEIMFGPDICGSDKQVHVIFSYNGRNLLLNREIHCLHDIYTHVYTLVIMPNNTYEVLIDNERVQFGELESDWNFLPPKKIKDPAYEKPEDWDDRRVIVNPNDKKPEDWDKPELIPDPAATKPEDWDEEMDGEWEPKMIDNPDFKGKWKPKLMANPNYKGVWEHPKIDNPKYKPNDQLYMRREICAIGFDLWQVKSGTIFNNILITDDIKLAKEKADSIWDTRYEGEHKMKEALEQEDKKNGILIEDIEKVNSDEDDEDNDEDDDEDIQYYDVHDEL